MVRTRGGSRLRPLVRFSTLEREEQALVPAPVPDPVPAPVPEAVPEEPQGFRRYQTGWDPGPHHRCLSGDPRGLGPPSGPVLPARVSHPHPGLSRHLLHQLQRRHHHHNYHLPPGSGGRYSSGTPSRGMYGSTAESFIRSRTMMSRS